MGFERREPKTYFKIKDGAIVVTINPEERENYKTLLEVANKSQDIKTKTGLTKTEIHISQFSGDLERIDMQQTEYGKVWNITFIDDFHKYIWTCYFDAGIFQGFINCLASLNGKYGRITLKPYYDPKAEATKLSLQNDGQKLNWKYQVDELPKVSVIKDENGEEMTDSKGNKMYNTKARMRWLQEEVDKIQDFLKQEAYNPNTDTQNAVPEPDDDDRF